jgi:hypothetical protein
MKANADYVQELEGKLEESSRTATAWEQSAAEFARGMEFYQGIVRQIGECFGVAARTSDDGSIQQDVLALKVPELVIESLGRLDQLQKHREAADVELMRFYSVENVPDLVKALSHHVEKLQAKLALAGYGPQERIRTAVREG